jgi:2,3-bisphosphoglycerate-dependent phosphoglycerate mutase
MLSIKTEFSGTLLLILSQISLAFTPILQLHPVSSHVPQTLRCLEMKSNDQEAPSYTVIFIRHGQSTWNKANRFIGWTDPNLTKTGELEARVAGQILLSAGYEFDVVFTSLLKRSIKTAWVVMDEVGVHHAPVIPDWRLNERCYGALVGQNKKECVRLYGEDQVKLWRRSFNIRPPPISTESSLWPGNNRKYKFLPRESIPRTESLEDTMKRSIDVWENSIKPVIRSGKRVFICGHENNLRSLLKHIDNVSDEDIRHVELPRAVPLIYQFDKDMKPIRFENSAPFLSGSYIGDAEEIEAIRYRDEANVYDLNNNVNLEETDDKLFAAKLDDLLQPCELMDDDDNDEDQISSGEVDQECRDTAIEETPLFLYKRRELRELKPTNRQ